MQRLSPFGEGLCSLLPIRYYFSYYYPVSRHVLQPNGYVFFMNGLDKKMKPYHFSQLKLGGTTHSFYICAMFVR